MKFNCDARRERRIARMRTWNRWFAWYPVRIAHDDCRWLENVERRMDFVWAWGWEYRSVRR